MPVLPVSTTFSKVTRSYPVLILKFDLTPEVIQQGRITQNKTKETPNTFAIEDGAAVVNPTGQMDKGDSRKAGVLVTVLLK